MFALLFILPDARRDVYLKIQYVFRTLHISLESVNHMTHAYSLALHSAFSVKLNFTFYTCFIASPQRALLLCLFLLFECESMCLHAALIQLQAFVVLILVVARCVFNDGSDHRHFFAVATRYVGLFLIVCESRHSICFVERCFSILTGITTLTHSNRMVCSVCMLACERDERAPFYCVQNRRN